MDRGLRLIGDPPWNGRRRSGGGGRRRPVPSIDWAMKLDVGALRYLSREEFRVLTAVEMGMKNHEVVPASLVDSIAALKRGGCRKALDGLLRHKLVHHENKQYDGFRLTPLGYDFLAIKALVNRGAIASVGRQIGVGKEADVFEVLAPSGALLVLKLHRLGRTSFRAVKSKRDYLRGGRHFNWLYLSRLAAAKEYAFMRALHDHSFRTPEAIDCNRHAVLMTAAPGVPLTQAQQLPEPMDALREALAVVARLARHGLVHCDLNEFNLIVNDDDALARAGEPRLTVIDFPQMVSVSHPNARMLFERDVQSLQRFFYRRFRITVAEEEVDAVVPQFDDHAACLDAAAEGGGGGGDDDDGSGEGGGGMLRRLDGELRASGFDNWMGEDLVDVAADDGDGDEESGESSDDESDIEPPNLVVRQEEDDAIQGPSSSSDDTSDDDAGPSDEVHHSEPNRRRKNNNQQPKDAAEVSRRVGDEIRARAAREARTAKYKAAMARGRAGKKGGKGGRDGF